MLFSSFLAVATLAFTASALPTEDKPFKIAFTVHGKTTYLAQSGAAVSDIAQATTCTIQNTALSCGGKPIAWRVGGLADMVQMKPGAENGANKGWVIKADGTLEWTSPANLRFGERTDSPRYKNQIWVENCHTADGKDKHGHSFNPGTAKVVY